MGLLEELALSKVKEGDEDAARSVLKVRQAWHSALHSVPSVDRFWCVTPYFMDRLLNKLDIACAMYGNCTAQARFAPLSPAAAPWPGYACSLSKF